MEKPARGRVITFYSYKGGTGRSMALANMAWLLALTGRKVLAIDWDLEAPGLHRYFHPFLSDSHLTSSDGVIDFVTRFIEDASAQSPDTVPPDNWLVAHANIRVHASPIDYRFPDGGVLDFIPAGRQVDTYAGRVNSFNWKHFYDKLGGWVVIDAMCEQLRKDYDFILVDSRTGVSDTSGICTIQIPDDVVVCFTLNSQSVDGASGVAASILEERKKRNKPVRIFPVPMRVEFATELLKREAAGRYARSRFLPLMDTDTVAPGAARDKYWSEIEVPYIGFFAFEEQLAWFFEPPSQVTGIFASIKRLATYAVPEISVDVPGPEHSESSQVQAQFGAVWTKDETFPSSSLEPPGTATYISFNEFDRGAIQQLLRDLGSTIPEVLRSDTLRLESNWADAFRAALLQSRAMVVAIGSGGLSAIQRRELVVALEHRAKQSNHGLAFPIVTLVLPEAMASEAPASARPVVHVSPLENSIPALVSALEASDTGSPASSCPYPGLRAFRTEEAELFHGRELYATQLVELARRSKTVVISGAPGSGRTSTVSAGLVPRLLAAMTGTLWKTVHFSAELNALESLAEALVRARHEVFSVTQYAAEVKALAIALRSSDVAVFRDAVAAALASWPAADRILVVVDDVTNLESDFVRQMLNQMNEVPGHLVLITGPSENPSSSSVDPLRAAMPIPLLTREELRAAIEEPARLAGVTAAPALVERMLNDLLGQAQQLPLLQFCLTQMWDRRTDRRMTIESYEAIGGVESAVAMWADVRFASIPSELQARAHRLLTRFFWIPDYSGNVVTRPLTGHVIDRRWQDAMNALTSTGLVVENPNGQRQPAAYQLFHPMLLERWPRLASAVHEERQWLEVRQIVEARASKWSDESEPLVQDADYAPPEAMLPDHMLALTQALAEAHQDDLTAHEYKFIQESVARAARDRASAERERKYGFVTSIFSWVRRTVIVVFTLIAIAVTFRFFGFLWDLLKNALWAIAPWLKPA